MKLSTLGSRDRRALMLGGVLLIPALLYIGVVKPYLGAISSVREQIEEERTMLRREQTLAKRLPALPEEKLAASAKLRQEAARLFAGEDELVATGNLAEYIATIADENGVLLQQSETRNGVTVAPGVRAIQVEVRADGDVYGIMHFLQQLETGNKLVRIGRLSIERGRNLVSAMQQVLPPGAPQPGGQQQSVDVLSLTASVYGYRLNGVPYGSAEGMLNGAPSPFPRVAIDLPSVDAIIDRNPFDPLRQAPNTGRYAGGDGTGVAPEQILRLVGTVISDRGRSFAVCFTGARTSQLVHVGEKVLGYTLQSVAPQRAVFTTPSGGHLVLETPPPGMYASSGMARPNNRGGPGGPGGAQARPNGAMPAGTQQGGQNQRRNRGESQGDNQRIQIPQNGFNGMDSASAQALRRRIMDAQRQGRPITVVRDSTGNSISIGGETEQGGAQSGARRRVRGRE